MWGVVECCKVWWGMVHFHVFKVWSDMVVWCVVWWCTVMCGSAHFLSVQCG